MGSSDIAYHHLKNPEVTATDKPVKFLSLTIENWYWLSQVASLILLFLTVVSGAAALLAGKALNARQSKQLLELQTSLEKQREKTALAEKAALELQRLIKEPRTIDRKHADEILDWGEKGSVGIFFSMLGDEPRSLAGQLAEILDAHGWQIKEVTPAIVPGEKPGIVIRMYGDTKEPIVATKWTDAPEPAKTLHRLLVEALAGNQMVETRVSSDRQKDRLEVTIGGKY